MLDKSTDFKYQVTNISTTHSITVLTSETVSSKPQ